MWIAFILFDVFTVLYTQYIMSEFDMDLPNIGLVDSFFPFQILQ